MDPWRYVDMVADTETGSFLSHGVRVNSVFSSYRLLDKDGSYSQRVGDLAGRPFPDLDSLTFELLVPGSVKPETVVLPFLAAFKGKAFTDRMS